MNIDFIKWMCEKAEGYSVFEPEDVDIPAIEWHDEIIDVDDFYMDTLRYPLLLQRAIEGVNRDNPKYVIIQNHKYIAVCDALSKRHMNQFSDMKIDKAKESALKYVYEQEAGMSDYRFRTDRKGRLILQITDAFIDCDLDVRTVWRDAKTTDITKEMAFDFVMGNHKSVRTD